MNDKDESIRDVMDKVAKVAPTPAEAPRPASQALDQIRYRIAPKPKRSYFGRMNTMFKNRYTQASVLVILLLVLAFSFPAVRAAASDFLGLFRVQKFAAISISPEQIALLEDLANSGLYPGEIQMVDEPGEPQVYASVEEVSAAFGQDIRLPSQLGDPDVIFAMDGGSARLVIDVTSAQAIMMAAGVDPGLIPDSLDGENVDATLYPSVSVSWSDGVTLMQTKSPLIEYPDDVDPTALGQALLQVLGMSEQEAASLAKEIVWTDTLLIPIPENVASFNEVTVDGGASGIALNSFEGDLAGILWQRDGIVYALSGGSVDHLINVANSLP
jgi:hypothetical protein